MAPSYPPLPPTLLLISTKSYFPPSRTLAYLRAILSPTSQILPPPHLRSHLLLAFIPDFLTLYPCSELLASHASTISTAYESLQSTTSTPPTPQAASALTAAATGHHASLPPILLGAQDCFWEPHYGAYTGCTVPSALSSLNISIVELGHAERRKFFHETDEQVALKARAASSLGMIPLVCVGELSRPPENGPMSMAVGNAMREIGPQVTSVLEALSKEAPVIIAYEPVWAIGQPEPAGVEYVGAVVGGIRGVVKEVEGKAGRKGETRVVYGGSAGPGLWGQKGLGEKVDGMFLGRFAHEIEGLRGVVGEVVGWLEGKRGRGKG
ncbi:MAG: hypothetical protein Q9227_002868 [Pyrenula ochraceoflavens]